MPRCENCHGGVSNSYHNAHVDGFASNLQCQVCHSQPYKNCTNCHNLASAEKGEVFWELMTRRLVELVEDLKRLSLDEIYQRRY